MRMSDFVVREAIIPELAANTKEGVIREMVNSLRSNGYFKGGEPEDIVKAILKRELLGSTGIGRGVAIPHTKHTSVDRLIGTVALSKPGVSFDSLDGEPRSGYDVSLALFGEELGPAQRRFAVAETLSHLERLVRERRAARTGDGAPVSYTGVQLDDDLPPSTSPRGAGA